MNEERAHLSLTKLGQALERLKEAIDEPNKTLLMIDGTIQRYEFTIELFWRTLHRLLETEGIIVVPSPREVLKEAYGLGWIDEEQTWIQMIRSRNLTSHVYNERAARAVYEEIVDYYRTMKRSYEKLQSVFKNG